MNYGWVQHGKILIGGSFTTVGGSGRNNMARLESNGALDTTFNPDVTGAVNAIAIHESGDPQTLVSIFIGGNFSAVSGQTHNRIARLNPNGTVDNAYNPSADAVVNAVAVQTVQTEVKLLIGGAFAFVNGTAHQRFARLRENGNLDTDFYQLVKGPDGTDDSVVNCIFLQPGDGKIVAGGNFTQVKGTPTPQQPDPPDVSVKNFMRFLPDGQVDDATFCTDPTGPNNTVRALAEDGNGLFVLGGDFLSFAVQGVADDSIRNRITRVAGY